MCSVDWGYAVFMRTRDLHNWEKSLFFSVETGVGCAGGFSYTVQTRRRLLGGPTPDGSHDGHDRRDKITRIPRRMRGLGGLGGLVMIGG